MAMRVGPTRWAVLAALLTTATPLRSLAQSDTDRATARAAATGGAKALEEGRYTEAIDLFRRAEAIIHAPPHLLYIARAQAKLGQLVSAHETYVKVTRETPDPDGPKAFVQAHDDAVAELAALEPRIPTLTITVEGARPDEVSLTIDGSPAPSAVIGLPRPFDPGTHVLRATASTLTSDDVTVNIAEGTPQTVKLALHGAATAPTADVGSEHQEASGGSRVPAYAALGVGAVGIVLGTVFMVQNRSKRGDADDLCPNGACPTSRRADIAALDDDANSAATRAWIGYGVGVVGLGVGAVLLLMNGGTSKTALAHRFGPVVGRGTFSMGGSF
jgi:hypothetical protein